LAANLQRLTFDTQAISEAPEGQPTTFESGAETLGLILKAETRLELSQHRLHLAELCSSVLETRSEALSHAVHGEVLLRPLREFRDITSVSQLNMTSDYRIRMSNFVFHDFQLLCERLQAVQARPIFQTNTAQEDFQWFVSNPPELAEHRGKYVAVLDKHLVADGDTMGEVFDHVSQQKLRRRPLLAFVPEDGAKVFGH